MAIFIDRPLWPSRGRRANAESAEIGRPRLWSHLISDVSYEELHAFAARLGVPPRAFERDHYDVPAELYDSAVGLGARPIGAQELVARLIKSGLRRRKRRRAGPAGADVRAVW